MFLGMSLTQRQTFECALCKRLLDEEQHQATAQCVSLFGTTFFAFCLACGMETGCRTTAYRREWLRRFVGIAVRINGEEVGLEFARQKLQRDFRPNVRCRGSRAASEYISYPFVEPATGKLMIMVREVDKPWTMRPVEAWQVPPVAEKFQATLEGMLSHAR